jgi:hypothetical protein
MSRDSYQYGLLMVQSGKHPIQILQIAAEAFL